MAYPAAQPRLSNPISTALRSSDGEVSSILRYVRAGPGRSAQARNARRAHRSRSSARRCG